MPINGTFEGHWINIQICLFTWLSSKVFQSCKVIWNQPDFIPDYVKCFLHKIIWKYTPYCVAVQKHKWNMQNVKNRHMILARSMNKSSRNGLTHLFLSNCFQNWEYMRKFYLQHVIILNSSQAWYILRMVWGKSECKPSNCKIISNYTIRRTSPFLYFCDPALNRN